MKARFNYDLTEVKEILRLARAVSSLDAKTEVKNEPVPQSVRDIERQRLIDRAEHLTQLMEAEKEKARAAQSNLSVWRAMNLLKAS